MFFGYETKRGDFCDACELCEDCGDYDFAYGAPMYQAEYECPYAAFDPDDPRCPRNEEWLNEVAEAEDRYREELRAAGWTEAEINEEINAEA